MADRQTNRNCCFACCFCRSCITYRMSESSGNPSESGLQMVHWDQSGGFATRCIAAIAVPQSPAGSQSDRRRTEACGWPVHRAGLGKKQSRHHGRYPHAGSRKQRPLEVLRDAAKRRIRVVIKRHSMLEKKLPKLPRVKSEQADAAQIMLGYLAQPANAASARRCREVRQQRRLPANFPFPYRFKLV